jgi:hypothetical protein
MGVAVVPNSKNNMKTIIGNSNIKRDKKTKYN